MSESSMKSLKSVVVISGHNRSKSVLYKKFEEHDTTTNPQEDMGQVKDHPQRTKNQSPEVKLQSSLKREISQLESQLQDQFIEQQALQKALGYKTSLHDNTNESSTPRNAKELIKEIAVLEYEVVHLEQYLLSLYRKAFDQQTSTVSPTNVDARPKSPLADQRQVLSEGSQLDSQARQKNSANQSFSLCLPQDSFRTPEKARNVFLAKEKKFESAHLSHSALSQQSLSSTMISPSVEGLSKAVRLCHSEPLSYVEEAQCATTNVISLAEHLGTRISDHVPETANRLSEDMIKCMSTIYCKLADPPLMHQGLSSPLSPVSSMSEFSHQDQSDMWSPQYRKDFSFDSRLDNPFLVEGLKEFSGPYSLMVEIPRIHRDSKRLNKIDDMLQHYRSLVCRLEEIDPRKLNHEEKLAFWINIHNALVMHAFLAYGIPQNTLKRVALVLKAAYNVGGHTISAEMIQNSILGCRMPRPGQWLWMLFSLKTKFKAGDDWQAYAIEHPEPLLHFTLCSGSHSDPAVRIYSPKRVFQEMELAKEEYIRATFGMRRQQKTILPKLLESFAKDSRMPPASLMEMIQQCVPENLQKTKHWFLQEKSRKSVEWTPHNFAFRYLISKELVK
ncbi:hypothetical protein Scep_000820 [Stephania cephalantha]|uniref:Electron transporter n=1 Tax=Stephania cephalantha TaxID=152367 RepID=A0AAP0LAW9_9MAGN